MNVILVLADQLSAKWLGCYGNAGAATPHLDRLAAAGTRFVNACANHPVCMPSRASLFTGRSARHHGVLYNGYELSPEMPTFARELQHAGVQTLGVGKVHLECHGRSAYNDVRKYGFDRAETTEDIRAGDWLDWVQRTWPQHYGQALATVWPMPHLSSYGPERRDLLSEIAEARRRHPARGVTRLTYPSVVPEEACQTRWVMDRGLAFLEERDRARPFFLYLSFVDPHDPYDPPERFLERIRPECVPRPVAPADEATARALARFAGLPFVRNFAAPPAVDWQALRRHYLASLAFIDEQVGRLTSYLQAHGLAEDTVVIFTADHGDMLGDHGLPTKGAWHLDACVRVPLLAAGPGVQSRCDDRLVSTLDLFPTLLDFAGVPCRVPVEGRSLRPLCCEGGGDLGRPDAALIETWGSYGDTTVPLRARTVRTRDAALTLFGDGSGMLFDLASDPHETTNLYGRPEAAGTTAELKDLLLELLVRQDEPLPALHRHPSAAH